MAFAVSMIWTVHDGALGWLRHSIDENPLACRVEVEKQGTTYTGPFESGLLFGVGELSWLRSGAASKAEKIPDVVATEGWTDIQMWFFDREGKRDERGYLTGRSVRGTDPLLLKLKGSWGDLPMRFSRKADGEGVGEVIVSENLLRGLGITSAKELTEGGNLISIDYLHEAYVPRQKGQDESAAAPSATAPLRVVGVCKSLSFGDYLVSDDFRKVFRSSIWNPVPKYGSCYLGPLSDQKPTEALLTNAAWTQLVDDPSNSVASSVEFLNQEKPFPAKSQHWLRLSRKEAGSASWQGWTRQEWAMFAQLLTKRLNKAGVTVPEDALRFPLEQPSRLVPDKDEWMHASVDFAKLENVPKGVDALRGIGYKVIGDTVATVELLNNLSEFGGKVLVSMVVLVAFVTGITIFLSTFQSVQRKLNEIGIFKAFGASNVQVHIIYLIEAAIVSLLGLVVSTALVLAVVAGVNALLTRIFSLEGSQLVYFQHNIVLQVAAATLLFCMAASSLAAHFAIKTQPARALKGV